MTRKHIFECFVGKFIYRTHTRAHYHRPRPRPPRGGPPLSWPPRARGGPPLEVLPRGRPPRIGPPSSGGNPRSPREGSPLNPGEKGPANLPLNPPCWSSSPTLPPPPPRPPRSPPRPRSTPLITLGNKGRPPRPRIGCCCGGGPPLPNIGGGGPASWGGGTCICETSGIGGGPCISGVRGGGLWCNSRWLFGASSSPGVEGR